jgi:hypothetical protein
VPFNEQLNDRELQSITPEEILTFLTRLHGDAKQTTKRQMNIYYPPNIRLNKS